MNEDQIIERLKNEGYDPVYPYTEGPNEVDEEHSHDFETKLVILEGDISITLESGGAIVNTNYKAGQEVTVPKGKKHSAKTGKSGCRYVVGEKH